MEQAHTHTYSEVRDLTVLLCRERGNSAAHAMLWEFGYKLNDLPPQHWPEFVNIAKQLLARDRMEYTTYREAVHAMMYRRASPTPTLDKLENEAEPKRAPLPHFNQRTDFDNFEGFEVHGTTSVDAAAIHPLQRISSMSHMLGNGIKG